MSNQQWYPGQFKLYSQYNLSCDGLDISLGYKGFDDKVQVLLPAQFASSKTTVPWLSAETGISPTRFLQDMLNAAWELGLRPTGFADQAGTLEATKSHLRDMRAIVGTKLKVQLP